MYTTVDIHIHCVINDYVIIVRSKVDNDVAVVMFSGSWPHTSGSRTQNKVPVVSDTALHCDHSRSLLFRLML